MTVDPNIAADPNGTGSSLAGNSGASDPNVASDPSIQADPNAGQQQAPVQQGRTYTQQQWDSEAARLRRSAKYEYDQNVNRIRAEYDRLMQQQARPAAPATAAEEQALFDDPTTKALEAFLQSRLSSTLAPMRERLEAADLNGAIAKGRNQYPDFAANEADILETMVSFGEAVVNSAPLEWLVTQAYYAWKQANFDEKAFKDSTIKEYVANARKRSSAPSPQGPGGTAPATPATDFGKKSWDDVSRAGQAEFDRVRRASVGA